MTVADLFGVRVTGPLLPLHRTRKVSASGSPSWVTHGCRRPISSG